MIELTDQQIKERIEYLGDLLDHEYYMDGDTETREKARIRQELWHLDLELGCRQYTKRMTCFTNTECNR